MKMKLALISVLLGGLVAGIPALAQTNALKNLNSNYGNWSIQTTSTIAAGSATVTLANCYVSSGAQGGNRQFFPPATNMTIVVQDGTNTETVTPSAVQTPTPAAEPAGPNPYTCGFTATFSNAHNAGVYLFSGDSGIGEAANDNGSGYGLFNGVFFLSGHCTGTTGSLITGGLTGWDPGLALACSTAFAPTTAGGTSVYRAGMVKGLSVTASAAGGSVSSGVVTIYKNGAATAITCTVGTGTSCVDATHSVAVVIGDVLSIAYTSITSDTLDQ